MSPLVNHSTSQQVADASMSVPTGPFLLPLCSDTTSPLPHPCGTPGRHCSVFRFHNFVISRMSHKWGRDVQCLELTGPSQRDSLEFHLGTFLSVCPCRCLWPTAA